MERKREIPWDPRNSCAFDWRNVLIGRPDFVFSPEQFEARNERDRIALERDEAALRERIRRQDEKWKFLSSEAGRRHLVDMAELPKWPERTGVLKELHDASLAELAAEAARRPPYKLPPSRKIPFHLGVVRGKRPERQTGSEIGRCLGCRKARKACSRTTPCTRCSDLGKECVFPKTNDPPTVDGDETLPPKRRRVRTQVRCLRCTQLHIKCDAVGDGKVACTRCRKAEISCSFGVQTEPNQLAQCTRCREKHLRCDRYADPEDGWFGCAQCTAVYKEHECSFATLTPRKEAGREKMAAAIEKQHEGTLGRRTRPRMKITFP